MTKSLHTAAALVRTGSRFWYNRANTIPWEKPPFEPKERVVAYMDLARNVFVAIGYGRVWCYRYKDS